MSADVRNTHPYNQAEYQRTYNEPLAVLGLLCIVGVDMKRMLVHRQQAEPRIVGFGDGAAWPVLEDLADFKIFKVSSERHRGLLLFRLFSDFARVHDQGCHMRK